jgi:hypothetical protein
MSQIVGNPSAGIGGHMLGLGLNGVGQVVHLFGSGDPNANTDASVASAAVGSLFSRLDGPSTTTCLYVKTAYVAGAAGTWTGK